MIQLRERDLITYRAPLAFHFTDAVTNSPVSNGLLVTAWSFLGSGSPPVHQLVTAEKSPLSGLYGFHQLPRLERYQIGDDVAPESLQYVVQIVDQLNRFLPQTVLVNLPLMDPVPQEVKLFAAPTRSTPPGFGTIRGDLRRTSLPSGPLSEVNVIARAAWAKVMLTIDGFETQTFADADGHFVGMVPFPSISTGTLLSEAEWPVTVQVAHDPTSISADLDLLAAARPGLDRDQTPPFQSTVEGQSESTLFNDVSVVDAATATYSVIGPTDSRSATYTYQFEQPLFIQTEIEGGPEHLSEFLIQS